MRNWKLWSGIVIFITILTLIIGAQSCSFINEPDQQDVWKMCENFDPEALGLPGAWTSDALTFELASRIDTVSGLRYATKYIPDHEPIHMLWGVYHIEKPLTNDQDYHSRGVLHFESPKGVYDEYRYQLLDQDHLWLQSSNNGRVYDLFRVEP